MSTSANLTWFLDPVDFAVRPDPVTAQAWHLTIARRRSGDRLTVTLTRDQLAALKNALAGAL